MDENASIRSNGVTRRPRLRKLGLKKMIIIGVSALAVVIVVLFSIIWYQSTMGANIDSSKFQAVFFTNGQVYFGKLETLNGNYMKLTDIFYLQTKTTDASGNPQETSTAGTTDVQLIKLGNEIHGPVDEMIISKDQMLFFENLKSDGKVAQSIEKYQKK
jgi:hypothetical protein